MDPVTNDEAPAASDIEALADDYKEDRADAAVGYFDFGEIIELWFNHFHVLVRLSSVCLSSVCHLSVCIHHET